MSITSVIADILLVAGLLIVLASCVGIAVMDEAIDRLHLVTPAAMLGSVSLCASVVVRTGLSGLGLAAILVGVIIAGTSPFVGHATARSILVRRRVEANDGTGEDPENKEQ